MLPASHHFTALGTQWQIDTTIPLPQAVRQHIHERVELFDRTYSRFRDDSLVHQLATTPGTYTFPDDARALFDFYRSLYDLTNGAVTPLIGAMLERAGYDANYSLTPRSQRPLPAWDDAMTFDGTQLTTSQPLTLDVGAAGKGYLVDIIGALLETAGITDYVVDGSGDLRHRGTTPHMVGLEHPTQPGSVIGRVPVENTSLCASSTQRRAWGDHHHIYDPRTMAPVRDIVATWVIAGQAMQADGLATALFFVDPSVLAQHYAFQYVRYHSNGSVDYSSNFQGELF